MDSSLSQSPLARFLILGAAFVVLIAGMKSAESLLVPFLLSLFIAVICSPPLRWIHQKGLPWWLAMTIVISSVVFVGLLVGAVVGSSINSFTNDLPEYQARLQNLANGLFTWIGSLGLSVTADNLREILNPSTAMRVAGTAISSLGNVMTNAFMILLTVIFILAEESVFYDKLRNLNPGSSKTLLAVERFTNSVNRYMALKTSMSLLTGLLVFIWLWLLGVDYPVLWAMIAFLLNFVPTLGSIIAAIPAVLLALVQLNPLFAALTAAGYLVVNVVVGNVLEPRYMGKGLDLSPLIVFLSLVFWGWVLGPVGMLLSIPLTMTVKIALESFEDTRSLGLLLGGGSQPVGSPEKSEQ